MTDVRKRSYSSDLRAEQARQTRWKVVQAAGELYGAQGFAATTIDAIAARARVSRKTVFTAVPGGKVELLKLAYDYAMAGDDEPVPMVAREGIQSLIREPDPYRRTTMYARFVTEAAGRIAPLYRALVGAAEIDPDARALYLKWEHERREAMLNGPVPIYLAEGVLRPDLTANEAADLWALLVGPDPYHRLVTLGGWTPDRFCDWLDDAMHRLLLIPPPSAATGDAVAR